VTVVALDWGTVRAAAHYGVDRNIRAAAAGRQPRYFQRRNFDDDIWGAIGEATVSQALDVYWPCGRRGPDRAGDVGRYHVRTTSHPDGRLILHPDDPDDAAHLLVVPAPNLPEMRIVGWCWGYEGKKPEHWDSRTGRPAFFVPRSVLRPLEGETP
jgi:hypothetical protein